MGAPSLQVASDEKPASTSLKSASDEKPSKPSFLRRLKNKFTRTDDDDEEPFDYGPPVFREALPSDVLPTIPDPGLFATGSLDYPNVPKMRTELEDKYDSSTFIPSVAQVAVHLELLECFAELRKAVEDSVEMRWFAHCHKLKPGEEEQSWDKETKWKIFVEMAVERFFLWREKLPMWINGLERNPAKEKEIEEYVKIRGEICPDDWLYREEGWNSRCVDGVRIRKLDGGTLPPLGK